MLKLRRCSDNPEHGTFYSYCCPYPTCDGTGIKTACPCGLGDRCPGPGDAREAGNHYYAGPSLPLFEAA